MEFDDITCTSCHKYGYCKQFKELNRKNATPTGRQPNESSPIRKCQIAICELYYGKIRDKDVLEIGCGNSKKGGLIKKIVEKNNCRRVGVDIRKTDLTTHVCNVNDMPFDDNSFDCVIGSQTFEHWRKPGKALKEIRRVLKPDGKVYLTAPIHLHGSKMFVAGDFNSIEKILLKSGFDVEKIERWRKHYCDLGPYLHPTAKKHLRYAKKHRRKFGTLSYEKITIYLIHCILVKSKNRARACWSKKLLGTIKGKVSRMR